MIMEMLCCLDWFTPLWSLLDRNVESIVLNSDEIWAADNLKRQGVRVRRMIVVPGGRIAFDVPVQQVGLAILLLRKMGIPVQDGKGRPWHRKKRRRK